jgi:hypothetical protein
MADEKLTLDLEVKGYGEAISRLGTLAGALEGLGGLTGGGGIGSIGSGLLAASRLGGHVAAIGVVTTALAALAAAARGAAATLGSFGRLQLTTGGTSAEAALATVLAGSLGISDVHGLAARARAGIASGLGAAQAAQLGIGPQLDIGRPVNNLKILLALMKDVYDTFQTDPGRALLRARNYGMEELVELGTLSKREFAMALEEAKEIERTYTPERIAKAREFNREMERLGRNFDRIKVNVGSRVIPPLNMLMEDPLLPFKALLPFGLNNAFFPKGGAGSQDQAVKDNTAAQNKNTRAIEQMMGVFGGGPRARGAIPAAFGPGNGYRLNDAIRAHTIRLGAYSVSL